MTWSESGDAIFDHRYYNHEHNLDNTNPRTSTGRSNCSWRNTLHRLCICKCDRSLPKRQLTPAFSQLWQNSMPSFTVTAEDRDGLRRGKAAHITAKIKRTPASATSTSSNAPVIHGLHVIRVNPPAASAASADDVEQETHYSWSPRVDLVAPTEQEISTAVSRGEALLRSKSDTPEFLDVNAWNGPRFSGNDVKYIVVAELAGGVFLKSRQERMQSVC